ncbi:MAG: hypothetical protein KBA91_02065, partial [Candidatus Moranbacteria bacterium]|nr:hypothetical protein [Candidatus Moranbacteria bacterium]
MHRFTYVKSQHSFRKKLLPLLGIFFILLAGTLFKEYIQPRENTGVIAHSSELNIADTSPLGDTAGLVVPASCPSDLHDDPNYGQPCTSGGNACGMTNSGTYNCGGSCNASPPSDALCCAWNFVSGDCSTYGLGSGTIYAEQNSCDFTYRNVDTSGCSGACTPDSSCAATTCSGQSCQDACGNWYAGTFAGNENRESRTCESWGLGTGTGYVDVNSCTGLGSNYDTSGCSGACTPDSSCAATTCSGQSCQDACGNWYAGTFAGNEN